MDENRGQRRASGPASRLIPTAVTAAVVLMAVLVASLWLRGAEAPPSGSQVANAGSVSAQVAGYVPLTAQQIARLPEARYDAVIPGLMPYVSAQVPAVSARTFTISADIPIYDEARHPVARFAFTNFAGRPTVIVPVVIDGAWAMVMTPARRDLPSRAGGEAPAQTAGWVRADALHPTGAVTRRVVISVARQTLAIEDLSGAVRQSFEVAVGAPGTPTPTGVTGYLEERYLDPQQGQATYPIQLTSLHSSAQDEPFQGEDGGLIGMHYYPSHAGTISHGCIRLSAEAVEAVGALPLGTSVTILP